MNTNPGRAHSFTKYDPVTSVLLATDGMAPVRPLSVSLFYVETPGKPDERDKAWLLFQAEKRLPVSIQIRVGWSGNKFPLYERARVHLKYREEMVFGRVTLERGRGETLDRWFTSNDLGLKALFLIEHLTGRDQDHLMYVSAPGPLP